MTVHKKIAFSVASLACGLVMWQAMKNTCPPRDQHLQAVTDVVERVVDQVFEERIQIPEESRQLAEYLSKNVIPQAVEKLTSNRMDFSDYGVFSMGNIEDEEGNRLPVSIGLFGRVFTTFSEEDVHEYINDFINDLGVENILHNLNSQNYDKETE